MAEVVDPSSNPGIQKVLNYLFDRSEAVSFKEFGYRAKELCPLLLSFISAAVVEGLNNKSKVTIRKSYGFNTYQAQRVMLFHTVGELPMPDLAHKFF